MRCNCLREAKRCTGKCNANCLNDGMDPNDGFAEIAMNVFSQETREENENTEQDDLSIELAPLEKKEDSEKRNKNQCSFMNQKN